MIRILGILIVVHHAAEHYCKSGTFLLSARASVVPQNEGVELLHRDWSEAEHQKGVESNSSSEQLLADASPPLQTEVASINHHNVTSGSPLQGGSVVVNATSAVLVSPLKETSLQGENYMSEKNVLKEEIQSNPASFGESSVPNTNIAVLAQEQSPLSTVISGDHHLLGSFKGINSTKGAIINERYQFLARLEQLGKPREGRVLLMPPPLFESHLAVYKSIGEYLKKEYNHELTILLGDRRVAEEGSPYFRIQRYQGLFSTEEGAAILSEKLQQILAGKLTMLQLFDFLSLYVHNCDMLLSDPSDILGQLRAAGREKPWDLMLVDSNDMCGFLIGSALRIPVMVLSVGLWIPYEAYVPMPLSYVPEFNSLQTDQMTFLQRLANTGTYGLSRFGVRLFFYPLYDNLIRKHGIVERLDNDAALPGKPGALRGVPGAAQGGNGTLSLMQLRKLVPSLGEARAADKLAAYIEEPSGRKGESSVLFQGQGSASRSALTRFVNNRSVPEDIAGMIKSTNAWLIATDSALEFPRPNMPHVSYIGGLSGRPAGPLAKDLQTWADAQKDGFIIASMGSSVSSLDERLERVFVDAFARIGFPVIWRYTKTVENLSPNVLLADWIPQNDLLGHPNAKLFVGHGGINGVYECLFHGVPLVGMPLFGDHVDAMVRVVAKGIGTAVDYRTVTADQLYKAMQEVISNPEYAVAMSLVSRVHKDRAKHPLSVAAERIDYLIRYEGAEHLRPRVSEIPFFQFWLLDQVTAVILLILLGNCICVWLVSSFSGDHISSKNPKSVFRLPSAAMSAFKSISPYRHGYMSPSAANMRLRK